MTAHQLRRRQLSFAEPPQPFNPHVRVSQQATDPGNLAGATQTSTPEHAQHRAHEPAKATH